VGTFEEIIYTIDKGVATIAINRPQKLNAVTARTLSEICEAISKAKADHGVGVLVITGVGDRSFCAGGDIEWEASGGIQDLDFQLGMQLADCPKPIIARVDGDAIGAGNIIAYFCDFTIATENSTFGQSGARVAGPPVGYATAHLAFILGHKRAHEMEMLCRHYTAGQALEWGLVNAVVPRDQLDNTVRKWCDDLLTLSPTVLAATKAAFRHAMEPYISLTLMQVLAKTNRDFFSSGEQQEGAAAFAQKRAPDFSRWR
jgi:2-ketocyclohexanecarboxyl-CoA hydrolase